MYQRVEGINVWGTPDPGAVEQMRTCAEVGRVRATALMADHHLGYSQPIGGVIAYEDMVSPTGVGFDIGCGVMAVRTDRVRGEIAGEVERLVDEIARRVSFGLGGRNDELVDHPLFDAAVWTEIRELRHLRDTARRQLGTVGSGNHYVDVLVEQRSDHGPAEGDPVWVACHFGSRGLGHRTASGFINLARTGRWGEGVKGGTPQETPALIDHGREPTLFESYVAAMRLAGEYAYAGREHVVAKVLGLLGAEATLTVHNHHNFAWEEEHDGRKVWVVRKGATPAFPGQLGFVGGSMGDIAAVVEGVDTEESKAALRSTVHGAGRVMSRSQARGSRPKHGRVRRPGRVTPAMMRERTETFGVVVRGGDVDESPHVYRPLRNVLDAHSDTLAIRHLLRPVGVVMAGAEVRDPYRD